ncbi:MAG TPA: MarR family winged helix-turn-helix transcriptional regulator [Variovorax sp.]|jgi:DNA-binding MarR family transcriptional regulator
MASKAKRSGTTPSAGDAREAGSNASSGVIDLQRYAPAYFTWIATKLSSGASQAYLATFGVGIEAWRILVLLAIEPAMSAQGICKVLGMDKSSVSRNFKTMQSRGLITIGLDGVDGRLRVASITPEGRAIHDGILGIALERERALMSVLSAKEREVLLGLLRRLHDNLKAVETATSAYLAGRFPKPGRDKKRKSGED